jgi:molecular chaperone DnaJ
VHLRIQTPTRLDADQEELLRRFAALRAETPAQESVSAAHHGLFARIKDAFSAK